MNALGNGLAPLAEAGFFFTSESGSFARSTLDIVLVSNQRDAAFVLLGLLSLYMFRTRFASIFRSNTQNCNGSHQCVLMRVGWSSPVSSGICTLNLGAVWFGCP